MRPEREALMRAIALAYWSLRTQSHLPSPDEAADRIIAAIESHNGGCRVMPIKPTQAMLEWGAGAHDTSPAHDLIAPMGDAYSAMIGTPANPYAPSSPTCNDHLQVGDPHPWYAGGCDALGPNGTCAECDKLKSSNDEKGGGR